MRVVAPRFQFSVPLDDERHPNPAFQMRGLHSAERVIVGRIIGFAAIIVGKYNQCIVSQPKRLEFVEHLAAGPIHREHHRGLLLPSFL